MTVSPGGEATTTLTVRNDSDIVEAYALEVVGDCAAWSTVEPARVSLYPGTSEVVTVRLAPPRSHEVRAGEIPLGVRVLPAEHPELVDVRETTVTVGAFAELRRELEPRRRRGWLGARYRTAVQNLGNTPVDVAFSGQQAGEEIRFAITPAQRRLEPGETAEARLRVRTRKPIWFGQPATWPFEVALTPTGDAAPEAQPGVPTGHDERLPGEFVQLPILPRWLLVVLAALLALLIAWFALVRPAVRSTAKQAATDAAQEEKAREAAKPSTGPGAQGGKGQQPGAQGDENGQDGGAGGSAGPGAGGGPNIVAGSGQQSSATIDVQTGGGAKKVGTYRVPDKKVFAITDLVVANFQGDEGVVTITFGERKITTIALETFRNQDYHWVTPIQIPENATVTASVDCAKPGTPATGKQASECHQVLNVSGVLSELKP